MKEKRLPDTPLSHPYTIQHPKTPLNTPKHSIGNVLDILGVIWECLRISEGVLEVLEGVRGARGGVW